MMTEAKILNNPFTQGQIETYSRMLCHSSKLPNVQSVVDDSMNWYGNELETVDPFTSKFLPPISQLLSWRVKLLNAERLASNHFYIECRLGRFDLKTVKNSIALLQCKNTKQEVGQEIDWFNKSYLVPHSVSQKPKMAAVNAFKSIIHNAQHNVFYAGMEMTPDELARLCCKRYISCDHVRYMIKCINAAQKTTLCIYLNGVRDVDTFVKENSNKQLENLLFLINIGKYQNNDPFVSTDTQPGCHWVVCFYSSSNSQCFYGDSLAWQVPSLLKLTVHQFVFKFFKQNDEFEIIPCHDPAYTDLQGRHQCGNLCSPNYPLQTCGNICGVICIIVAAIFCLAPQFFEYLMKKDNSKRPNLFITHPTKYSKYLRLCVIAWMTERAITIANVVPYQLDGNEISDSDSDIEVERFYHNYTTTPEVNTHTATAIKTEAKGTTLDELSNEKTTFECLNSKKTSKTEAKETTSKPDETKAKLTRFPCHICSLSSFTRRNDLKRHIVKFHGEENVPLPNVGKSLCVSCGYRCNLVSKLREHLQKEHGMIFKTEHIEFKSYNEFEDWKYSLEDQECCTYVLLKGSQINQQGFKVNYWQCNRSGIYKPARQKKKRSKKSGTCKIDKNCTCTIKVTIKSENSIEVDACHTHYGHIQELQHTWITKRARQEIASKVRQGVTVDKIIDDIRNNAGDVLKRSHIVDRRDVYNISRGFGLNEIIRHNNDQMSVLSWIRSYSETNDNPILFYKLQGDDDTSCIMKSEDFMIVLQTASQRDLLQRFGDDGVCCDSTHKTTGYDFLLMTLLVVDEMGKGQPVAWCLSNHETEEFIKIFFQKVKDNIGRSIKPRWFMSDLAPQFYNSFCTVMENCPKWLYCVWHVDKNWQEEIRTKCKGLTTDETAQIQKSVYQMAKMIMETTSEAEFDEKLENFIARLESKETQPFKEYFIKHYYHDKRRWGYCYRVGDCINTNMFVESFHRSFQYKYLKGKYNKRVDVCLINLLKYARDKVFDRLIDLTKGASGYRARLIAERHFSSLSMDLNLVTKTDDSNSFRIKDYVTLKLADSCPVRECQLKCSECKICSHTFHCSCPDFMVNYLGCKHIHLLKRYLTGDSAEKVEIEHHISTDQQMYAEEEVEKAFDHIKSPPKSDHSTVLAKTMYLLTSLKEKANLCSSLDTGALEHLNTQLLASTNTFEAMCKFRSVTNLKPLKTEPSNKKIEKQPNFFSTTRKRKSKGNVRFAKPSMEDVHEFYSPKPWENGDVKEKNEENGNGNNEGQDHDMAGNSTENKESLDVEKNNEIVTSKKRTLGKAVKKLLELFGVTKYELAHPLTKDDIILDEDHPGDIIIFRKYTSLESCFTAEAWCQIIAHIESLKESWRCFSCHSLQNINMVACDSCGKWFHWKCVGIAKRAPEDWLCERCS